MSEKGTGPQPMPTADERERRIVQYLLSVHRERIGQFRLSRMNRVANFRKQLIILIDQMIETRAEEIAAAMLEEYAEPMPKLPKVDPTKGRLVIPGPKKIPAWVRKSGQNAG